METGVFNFTISLRDTSNLQIFAHELKIFIFPFYCLSTDVDECINNHANITAPTHMAVTHANAILATPSWVHNVT